MALPRDRLRSTSWCQCSKCLISGLRRAKECYCCREIPAKQLHAQKLKEKLGSLDCISLHPDFQKYCADKEVSKYVLRALVFSRDSLTVYSGLVMSFDDENIQVATLFAYPF